jgi:ferric-dicitrate binding protein FerR (iron transport regulator)
MTISNSARVENDDDEAVNWIARLRAQDVTDLDRARFIEWIADAANRDAFDRLLYLWEGLPEILRRIPDDHPWVAPPPAKRS